jgi:hypothetical protein
MEVYFAVHELLVDMRTSGHQAEMMDLRAFLQFSAPKLDCPNKENRIDLFYSSKSKAIPVTGRGSLLKTPLMATIHPLVNPYPPTYTPLIQPAPFLQLALWNANGLAQHALELQSILTSRDIDIMLLSETHFTLKNYLRIPHYTIYHTNHPAGTD